MDTWHGSAGLARCLVWFPGVKHEKKVFCQDGEKNSLWAAAGKKTYLQHIHFSWS
jgi:hypothetical protein